MSTLEPWGYIDVILRAVCSVVGHGLVNFLIEIPGLGFMKPAGMATGSAFGFEMLGEKEIKRALVFLNLTPVGYCQMKNGKEQRV